MGSDPAFERTDAMSDGAGSTLAWLYDDGTWRLSAELLPGNSAEVTEDLARAGYCEPGGRGGRAQEFLQLGSPPEEGSPGTRLRLFVGPLSERPQCVILVDGPTELGPLCVCAEAAGRPGPDGQVGADRLDGIRIDLRPAARGGQRAGWLAITEHAFGYWPGGSTTAVVPAAGRNDQRRHRAPAVLGKARARRILVGVGVVRPGQRQPPGPQGRQRPLRLARAPRGIRRLRRRTAPDPPSRRLDQAIPAS